MKGNIKLMKKLFNILLVLLLSIGVFTSNKVVEAEESFTTKYAVQIYGIEQDELKDGSTAGLTFGPALGQDFMNTFISHTPTGTTTLGNPHRCIHDDEWETIARWNHEDPYVYEQCVSNNCTHSVKLTLSDTLRKPGFVYGGSNEGDGVGVLHYEMQVEHREWNPLQSADSTQYGTNYGGWGASRIRAMLNGADSLTTTGTNYGTSVNPLNIPTMAATDYTGSDTLLSAFPQVLQDNIGARKTLYDSVYNQKVAFNLKTSYDKLWLLSSYEMANSISNSYYQHPLEAPNGKYQKFIDNNLNLSTSSNNAFRAFEQGGNTAAFGSVSYWLLRSSSSGSAYRVLNVDSYGKANFLNASHNVGVAPCFSLDSSYVPSYDPADPIYDPQADEGNYTTKRGINALNEWVKNDNTWTYTFDVFDDQIPYYIWEDIIPGYTSKVMKPGYDYFNENGEKYYEIINRSTTLGNLEISKTVVSNKEIDHKFDFTITLQGNGLEGIKTYSGVIFEDGVGRIKLGHNEKKLIEGLPSSTTYTVEEAPYGAFSVTSTNATGTIESGSTQKVSFENTYIPKSMTNSGHIKLKKTVTGNSQTEEKFKFMVMLGELEANEDYVLSNGQTFTADALGNAIVSVELGAGEEVVFSGLPFNTTYQISEEPGAYTTSYSIIDANDSGLINQSADENTQEDVALTTALEKLETGEDVTIEFSNHIVKYQNIKIQKEVIGKPEDKQKNYEITVELFNLKPNSSIESDAGRFVADEDGYAIKTILLKDGEEFVIPNVPVGTQFVMSESANSCYASYEITDANGGNNFEKAQDTNTVANKELSTQKNSVELNTVAETVNEDEENVVKFTNRSEVTITLKKEVSGSMGNKTDMFNFTSKVTPLEQYAVNPEDSINGIVTNPELSHDDTVEYKAPYGSTYEFSEENYSNIGYKTYVGNSLFQSRETSGTFEQDKVIVFRNVNGSVIPTGIKLLLPIPLMSLVSLVIFLALRKTRRKSY